MSKRYPFLVYLKRDTPFLVGAAHRQEWKHSMTFQNKQVLKFFQSKNSCFSGSAGSFWAFHLKVLAISHRRFFLPMKPVCMETPGLVIQVSAKEDPCCFLSGLSLQIIIIITPVCYSQHHFAVKWTPGRPLTAWETSGEVILHSNLVLYNVKMKVSYLAFLCRSCDG